MGSLRRGTARAMLAGATLAIGLARDVSAPGPALAQDVLYETSCEVMGRTTVWGYVSNLSADDYRVSGVVSFSFTRAGSITRPALSVEASAHVPPSQKALVVWTRLPFLLDTGEACRFDVGGAIQRAP